jgi:hypothetical protein
MAPRGAAHTPPMTAAPQGFAERVDIVSCVYHAFPHLFAGAAGEPSRGRASTDDSERPLDREYKSNDVCASVRVNEISFTQHVRALLALAAPRTPVWPYVRAQPACRATRNAIHKVVLSGDTSVVFFSYRGYSTCRRTAVHW